MTTNGVWENVTSGKFFSSGTIAYFKNEVKYIDARTLQPDNPNALWDTVRIAGKKYSYKNDKDAFLYVEDTSLRPCLKQCMSSFLKEPEQQFITNAFNRAYNEMQKHCDGYFASTMVLSPPKSKIAMHVHSRNVNPTFTYIVSSNTSKPENFIALANPETNCNLGNWDIKIEYPHCSEFYVLFDSGLMHGTKAIPNDNNYYMYFVFDGVTVTDSELEYNKCYSV